MSEVAGIGQPDPKSIAAQTAVVVPRTGASVTACEIQAHSAALLFRFKHRRRVFLADSLPGNPSGKVPNRDLRLACG